MTESEKLS